MAQYIWSRAIGLPIERPKSVPCRLSENFSVTSIRPPPDGTEMRKSLERAWYFWSKSCLEVVHGDSYYSFFLGVGKGVARNSSFKHGFKDLWRHWLNLGLRIAERWIISHHGVNSHDLHWLNFQASTMTLKHRNLPLPPLLKTMMFFCSESESPMGWVKLLPSLQLT